jgi:hypothetical protein
MSNDSEPVDLAGHDSGDGNSGIGSAGEEMEKHPATLDTEADAACYNRDTASPGWFQAQPKWGISV